MTRAVYLQSHGHVTARGSGTAAAQAVLAGDASSVRRTINGANNNEDLPYFRLPLDGGWEERSTAALAACRATLSAATGLPLFFASSSFQAGASEAALAALRDAGQPLPDFEALPEGLRLVGHYASDVARQLDCEPLPWCFSNACTSGLDALQTALRLMQAGLHEQTLVAGTELDNRLSGSGFHSLGLLSRTRPQPFAAARDGLVLGEAVAALQLSTTPSNNGWRIAACELGLDSHSLTGINPSGNVVAQVMRRTLEQAGVAPGQIDLVKLHAAGVGDTDLAEARALRQVFGARMPPLLSLKPWIGHTQGASSLAELALLLDCLALGRIPGHPGNEDEMDVEVDLSLPRKAQPLQPRRILLNTIGFGGSIGCVLLCRDEA